MLQCGSHLVEATPGILALFGIQRPQAPPGLGHHRCLAEEFSIERPEVVEVGHRGHRFGGFGQVPGEVLVQV